MSGYAKLLLEKRANIHEQAKGLLDKAEGEKRELTAEEQVIWDRYSVDMRDLKEKVDAIVEGERLAKEADEELRKVVAAGVAPEHRSQRDFDEEFRKLWKREIAEVRLDVSKRQAAGLYSKRSRQAWMRASEEAEMRAEVEEMTRAMSVGSATGGGNTVPTSFYNQLIRHMITDSAIMAAGATIMHTSSGESLQIPVTTAYTTGTLTAEAAALTESDPAFALRTLTAFKYGALITVSHELLEDSAFPLVSFIADQAGEGVTNTFGTDLVTGNGSSKPRGILQDTTLGKTGGTGVGGAPTADDLIDLYYSVIAKYRRNGSWLMADATTGTVRKLKDTTGQYLWQPSLAAGTPDIFLGKPIYNDPNMPAVAVSAKSVAFGDISKYFVRLVNSIRFERSDDVNFATDQVVFRCIIRGDGALVDRTGAVKHFAGGAS